MSIRSTPRRTGNSASCTGWPLTRTRPSLTQCAACVREPRPILEITRATPWRGSLVALGGDLDLMTRSCPAVLSIAREFPNHVSDCVDRSASAIPRLDQQAASLKLELVAA